MRYKKTIYIYNTLLKLREIPRIRNTLCQNQIVRAAMDKAIATAGQWENTFFFQHPTLLVPFPAHLFPPTVAIANDLCYNNQDIYANNKRVVQTTSNRTSSRRTGSRRSARHQQPHVTPAKGPTMMMPESPNLTPPITTTTTTTTTTNNSVRPTTITTTFIANGPLGLELSPRRNGGVMICRMIEGGLAHRTNKLRKAMRLLTINQKDVSKSTVNQIVQIINSADRPLKIV